MGKNQLLFFLFFLNVIFDSIFFNIDLGLLNVTLLRIVLLVFLIVICKKVFKDKYLFINKNIKPIIYFFALWFIYMLFSLIWVPDRMTVIKGIYYYLMYLLIILVIIYLVKRKLENKIFYSINLVAIFMGLLSLIEYFGLIRFSISRYSNLENEHYLEIQNFIRVTGTFVNENDYSLYLAILFPFLFINILKFSTIRKIVSLICIPEYIFIIYNNDAKLVLIMIVIELIVLMLSINWKRKLLVRISVLSISFFGLILFIRWFNELLHNSSESSSISVRWNLLLNTWYALKETSFIGGGISNFHFYLDINRNFGYITNPHNWWVELLIEHGILITILYIVVYCYIIMKLIKIYKNPNSNNLLVLPLIMIMIGLIIGSIAPSGFFYFWPNWFILGLSMAIINNEKVSDNE